MDYRKHYDLLIGRAKNRLLEEYTERHHIIPKCIGGSDSSENLVSLTPEEHYIAHQLLVKIYPKERGLIYAALMMCSDSKNTNRSNKLYGWIKRKYSEVCKQRIGDSNGSYGTMWINNGIICKKVKKDSIIPEGYKVGRSLKKETQCIVCGENTKSVKANYCFTHRNKRNNTNPNEVLEMYESGVSLDIILEKFGWNCEQNVTGYLRKHFPNRKKFKPKERIKSA
jgi:hypothetical protein